MSVQQQHILRGLTTPSSDDTGQRRRAPGTEHSKLGLHSSSPRVGLGAVLVVLTNVLVHLPVVLGVCLRSLLPVVRL